MKIHISEDEWYPVYDFEASEFDPELEVDEATLKRWQEAFDAFDKVQGEMKAIFNKSTS